MEVYNSKCNFMSVGTDSSDTTISIYIHLRKNTNFKPKKKSAEMQAGHNTVQQILNNISQNV